MAIDWHNATVGSVGSSPADAGVSPHQRFTLRAPKVMDLAAFGCRAVVLKVKPSVSRVETATSLLSAATATEAASSAAREIHVGLLACEHWQERNRSK